VRGGLQRLWRREASLDLKGKLVVQAGALIQLGNAAAVGTGEEPYRRFVRGAGSPKLRLKVSFVRLDVIIRVAFSLLMLVLVVLLVSWLALRGIGAAGVHALGSCHDSARYALVVMFMFTATAHFNKMKHDLAQMIPAYLPRPLLIVYITGILELLGAAGLMLPHVMTLAGICLIALLVGMFIANINAAQKGVTLRSKPPTPLWLRAPMQVLFIGLLWWSTRP